MDKLKPRSEIKDIYKWSLYKMYPNKDDIENDIKKVKELHKEILGYKDKIMDNSENLYNFYVTYLEYDRITSNLYTYSYMLYDEDTKNQEHLSLKMRIEKLIEDLSIELSFITPEMLSVSYDDVLKMIEENPKLNEFKFDLEKTFRYKKYTLSGREEEIIATANNAMGTGDDVFTNIDNSDIHFDDIEDENKKLVELNQSNYIEYLKNKNQNVRESAFKSMYKYFGSLKNTIAATYKAQIKEDFFNSNIRKYNSPLEQSLYMDNIDKSVYTNLIDTIHNNMDKMYKYVDLRKKILNLDELHMYDLYVDLCDDKPQKISFEEGKKIVFEALKPLGEDYINDLQKAFDEQWIDVYPNIGKKSGAYSFGTYDSYPYLLLNYNDSLESVSTMAHELGHSMHSYYSNKCQNYVVHNYPIFLAEIASTVNEILLNDYLYKNAKTKEEKKLYLSEFLEKIKGTIYRQTMFAEFEMKIHNKYEEGISLTEEEISSTYYELNKLYFGDNIVIDNEIRYEWARIPHFYTPFYVYKYATGISAAMSFASDILENKENAKEKYLKFLSSGGSDYPLAILKKAGIDMTSSEPIEKALNMFEQKLQELEELS